MEKEFYKSKTFWVNVLALIGIICQSVWGFVISAEIQAAILIIINLILRALTKEEIVWGRKK